MLNKNMVCHNTNIFNTTLVVAMAGSDADLNYLIEGTGPHVVLVHGVGANLTNWDQVVPRLSPDFTVMRMDLRGHGASPLIREPYTLEKFCADIIATMDRAGIAKAHLAGFSLGGLIAQCLAVNYPDRFDRIAILSAVAGRTPEEREKVTGRLALLRKGGFDSVSGAARDRWFTDRFIRENPDKVEDRLNEIRANDLESYIEAYRIFGESEMAERLHEIQHRTLVLTGENDIGSNTRMAALMHVKIPNSRLVILPELKHSLLVEAPEIIADHLIDFFKKP